MMTAPRRTMVRVDTFEMSDPPKLVGSKTIDVSRSNRRAWLTNHVIWCAMNGYGVQTDRDWKAEVDRKRAASCAHNQKD